MATKYRVSADEVSQALIPKLPTDFQKGGSRWAQEITRAIELWLTVILGIQDAGTKLPLRAWLDFEGASVTDDPDNDRIQVSIAGGAGAAPKNASYIVVGLNGTLTADRVMTAGTGLTATDGGANGNFTLNVGAGLGITVNADDVAITNTGVGAGSYGSATQVPSYTVNAQGQLTAAANVPITFPVPTVVGSAFTVSTLPVAPPQGTRAWVTDAAAPTFLATLVGSGAVVCPAFYDGTNWVAA